MSGSQSIRESGNQGVSESACQEVRVYNNMMPNFSTMCVTKRYPNKNHGFSTNCCTAPISQPTGGGI